MVTCRICSSDKVEKFLELGPTPLANSFLSESQLTGKEEEFPLDLCLCPVCGLVQLGYVVPPEKMFRNYLYVSSTSKTLSAHFVQLAAEIVEMVPKGSLVVEFASNDGTLLKNFAGTGIKALGVEPAENVAKIAVENGVETICEFFNEESAKAIAVERGRAAAIIGTNVFAHVPDLHGLLNGVGALLADDGTLVLEFPYLADMVGKLEFDTTYHEHLSYFAVAPLVRLFDMHGMVIVEARRTTMHGGSLLLFVKKTAGGARQGQSVDALLEMERASGLADISAMNAFAAKVHSLKDGLVGLMREIKSQGKTVAAYGAAAKGNTLLNYCGLGKETIDFIADKSPLKQGLYAPGNHVPVVPPEEIMARKPDYVLILAWNLADEIMTQLSTYRAGGGKFIIPVPEPRIVA
jgi:SAM-dependent methyltransferase